MPKPAKMRGMRLAAIALKSNAIKNAPHHAQAKRGAFDLPRPLRNPHIPKTYGDAVTLALMGRRKIVRLRRKPMN